MSIRRVAWVASTLKSTTDQPRSMRRKRALVASGGHPTTGFLGLPRFIGRPSSATLATPVIVEC